MKKKKEPLSDSMKNGLDPVQVHTGTDSKLDKL